MEKRIAMQIKDYILNITKESVASYYELKVKSEERGAFITIILVTFGIFTVGPFLLTRMLLDLVDLEQYGSFMDIVIMESLVIVILALCLLNNAYRAGKLYKRLKKHESLDEMIQYVHNLNKDDAMIYIAWILHFKQYDHSYMTKDGELVISYWDGMEQRFYSTYDMKRLCDPDCENAILYIDTEGACLVNADSWYSKGREVLAG